MKVLYLAYRVLLVLVLAICISNAFGQEATVGLAGHWPTIRGPMLDGHSLEIGIAETWPPEGPPVLWTRELGQGY